MKKQFFKLTFLLTIISMMLMFGCSDDPVSSNDNLSEIETAENIEVTVDESQINDTDVDSIVGGISGSVQSASTNDYIEDAIVELYQDGSFLFSVNTGEGGSYVIQVLPGTYNLRIVKDGFYVVNYQNVIIESGLQNQIQTAMVISQEYTDDGIIEGLIDDGVNSDPIFGAELNFREGINARTGMIIGSTTVDEGGRYTISLPTGTYTMEVVIEGYSTSYRQAFSLGGEVVENVNLSLNPIREDVVWWVKLEWGETPMDLDAHLTGPSASGERFHIYFLQQTDLESGTNLDRDVTNSYGPETVSILNVIDGVYRYSVHDYTNRNSDSSMAMANSNAVVELYYYNDLVETFYVPREQGTLWTVFEIRDNQVHGVNNVSYVSTASDVFYNDTLGDFGVFDVVGSSLQYDNKEDDSELIFRGFGSK